MSLSDASSTHGDDSSETTLSLFMETDTGREDEDESLEEMETEAMKERFRTLYPALGGFLEKMERGLEDNVQRGLYDLMTGSMSLSNIVTQRADRPHREELELLRHDVHISRSSGPSLPLPPLRRGRAAVYRADAKRVKSSSPRLRALAAFPQSLVPYFYQHLRTNLQTHQLKRNEVLLRLQPENKVLFQARYHHPLDNVDDEARVFVRVYELTQPATNLTSVARSFATVKDVTKALRIAVEGGRSLRWDQYDGNEAPINAALRLCQGGFDISEIPETELRKVFPSAEPLDEDEEGPDPEPDAERDVDMLRRGEHSSQAFSVVSTAYQEWTGGMETSLEMQFNKPLVYLPLRLASLLKQLLTRGSGQSITETGTDGFHDAPTRFLEDLLQTDRTNVLLLSTLLRLHDTKNWILSMVLHLAVYQPACLVLLFSIPEETDDEEEKLASEQVRHSLTYVLGRLKTIKNVPSLTLMDDDPSPRASTSSRRSQISAYSRAPATATEAPPRAPRTWSRLFGQIVTGNFWK